MTRRKDRGDKSKVRIIAGQWKGRRLRIVADGTRPTPDRVRETVFNWLAPVIEDRRGLDLFAGTGALGIEALSRGAAQMVFVERDRAAAQGLRETLKELGCTAAQIRNTDAGKFLQTEPSAFDLVFLDPPFDGPGLENLCTLLASRGWLTPGAFIYLETGHRQGLPALPDSWELLQQKSAGQVVYALAQWNG
jgi:16S rRNA (guanine966-N2)-methyltransferase